MLHAVATRSPTTATAAVLKDSSSFFTDIMLAHHALVVSSVTAGRSAGDGCKAKVANQRFNTMPPSYELTTLLRRTIIYASERSDRAAT